MPKGLRLFLFDRAQCSFDDMSPIDNKNQVSSLAKESIIQFVGDDHAEGLQPTKIM